MAREDGSKGSRKESLSPTFLRFKEVCFVFDIHLLFFHCCCNDIIIAIAMNYSARIFDASYDYFSLKFFL